jgi:hypothetical protein
MKKAALLSQGSLAPMVNQVLGEWRYFFYSCNSATAISTAIYENTSPSLLAFDNTGLLSMNRIQSA